VPEEIAHVVLCGARLEQPRAQLRPQIVKVQVADARPSARRTPRGLDRADLFADFVPDTNLSAACSFPSGPWRRISSSARSRGPTGIVRASFVFVRSAVSTTQRACPCSFPRRHLNR
jgi:hypothetical protein